MKKLAQTYSDQLVNFVAYRAENNNISKRKFSG